MARVPSLAGLSLVPPRPARQPAATNTVVKFQNLKDYEGGGRPARVPYGVTVPPPRWSWVPSEKQPSEKVKGDSITHDEFTDNQEVIILGDGHVYDPKALKKWFETAKTRAHPHNRNYVATDEELEELGLTPKDVTPPWTRDSLLEFLQESNFDDFDDNFDAEAFAALLTSYSDDNQVILLAVSVESTDESCLRFASPRLQDDETIVKAAFESNGTTLQFASLRLRDDETIVKAAVETDGEAFEYASERLRGDRDIAMAALEQSWVMLKYASPHLQNDEKVVEAAMNARNVFGDPIDYGAFEFAGPIPRDNEKLAIKAMKTNGTMLRFASARLQNAKAVVMAALNGRNVANHYVVLQHAGPNACNMDDVVMRAVKKSGQSLRYASERLRNDAKVVFEAVRRDGTALQYASEPLKNDLYIINTALGQDWKAIHFASVYYQKQASALSYWDTPSSPAAATAISQKLPKVGPGGAYWSSSSYWDKWTWEDTRFSWD